MRRTTTHQAADRLRQHIAAGNLDAARRLLNARISGTRARRPPGPAAPLTLQQAHPGSLVRVAPGAKAAACYRIVRPLAEVADEAPAIAAEYAAVLRGRRERFDELAASPGLCRAADADPADVLLCKVQPCDPAQPVFLVGVLAMRRGVPTIEQLLARRLDEEPAVLRYLAECLPSYVVLATYKDTRSEVNCLAGRAGVHEVPWPTPKGPPDNRMPTHLDLRAEVRRRWKGRLRGFRLARLEHTLCGRIRPPRLSRRNPPEAYGHFLSTGDARGLADVLEANALDLLTMAQLVTFLLTGTEPAELF